VCLHLSLRATVGYFQQWRNVNSSFSANSECFSIFNSKGPHPQSLVIAYGLGENTQHVRNNEYFKINVRMLNIINADRVDSNLI